MGGHQDNQQLPYMVHVCATAHLSCANASKDCMQVHSKNLQQVLDIVVSHQALPLKCQLLLKLLLALVAPAPEHQRALLRRLAGLSGMLQTPTTQMTTMQGLDQTCPYTCQQCFQ